MLNKIDDEFTFILCKERIEYNKFKNQIFPHIFVKVINFQHSLDTRQ